MILYVLVPRAVYDHGTIGVYSSEERAREAAEAIWPETDGHHAFRIDVVELDETYENVFEYTLSHMLGSEITSVVKHHADEQRALAGEHPHVEVKHHSIQDRR